MTEETGQWHYLVTDTNGIQPRQELHRFVQIVGWVSGFFSLEVALVLMASV